MIETLKKNENRIINTHYLSPFKFRYTKQWAKASGITGRESQKRQNSNPEASYHQIIDFVKTHYLKPGERYFERDYKDDPTTGYLAMHCFLTQSFYIYLECNLAFQYNVEYSFYNCQYQTNLMKLLKQYPFDIASQCVELKPNFKMFSERTFAYQGSELVHCFKG